MKIRISTKEDIEVRGRIGACCGSCCSAVGI